MLAVVQKACGFAFLFLSLSASAVNVEHQAGTTVLSEVPQRVAALNWTQAEMLLTLGITPAGITTLKGYRQWQSNTPPMPEGVSELGHRAEPSLEAIAALKPDLILGYDWRHNRIYPELNAIAPTVLYGQYPSAEDERDYLARMQEIFQSVAGIFRQQELAATKITEMQQELARARALIREAELTGHRVVVGKFVGMGLGLRVYGKSSLASAIVTELGLENGWTATLPGRDFTHVDLLKLTSIGDASLVIMGGVTSDSKGMTTSPVWQSLPAVREGRVYFVPSLWTFGGPLSAMRMTRAFVDQLVPGA
ncbi:MAG: iron-siderophore ABC transporter substrate-binding protein [Endozoicomonas sp.]